MNAAMIALELRKNRLTLVGLALIFILVPPLSALVAPRAGLGLRAAVEAGLVLWTLAGLPLAAVFLGTTAGAGLRASVTREAESPLPVSSAARVAYGLSGALLQFVILAAGTSLICSLVELEEGAGAPVRSWPLPTGTYKARVLEGGVLLQQTKTPFFMGWDGVVRALRAT